MISKGMLTDARELVQTQAAALASRLADGTPILGLEPSCILTLADEWPELLPGLQTQRIAAAAHLADEWLAGAAQAGKCDATFGPRYERCLLHGHCHQKALRGSAGSAAALKMIPGFEVAVLDAGCCGMAGSFGYERQHYDLSVAIANLQLVPALDAQPEAIAVATGTSCRHQIRDLTGRTARHPMEVLGVQLC